MSHATRAIRIERHGPPEILAEREVPIEDPGPGEISVRVEAAGVNFADLLMRTGLYGTVPPRPYTPGFEVAGRVREVGDGVSAFREGDPVVALKRFGGYAAEVIVPAASASRYPASLSPAEASALPVVFLTAAVCLFEAARVRDGERALILGAGGGVGTAAVQLARRAGLETVGTAGTDAKRAFVTGTLGADACFDSRGDWPRQVAARFGRRPFDVVLDPVGGRGTARSLELLAPLGRLVFYGLSEALAGRRRSRLGMIRAWLRTPRLHPLSLVEPNRGVLGVHLLHLSPDDGMLRRHLDETLTAVGRGELRPVLDRTFPLTRDGAVAAHTYLHERRNLGKVVLTAA